MSKRVHDGFRAQRHQAKTCAAGASMGADRLSRGHDYSLTRFRRSALPMTLTEESAIAAAAMIGESSKPKSG